jgi:AIG2-like family
VSSMSCVWYFAYGSNMQSATFCGRRGITWTRARPARAIGWRLVFDKPPFMPTGESYANIVPDLAGEVFGVVYELSPQDMAHVELTEAVPLGNYERVEIPLRPLDAPDTELVACTLTSTRRDTSLRPSERYLAICIEGAREHRLPAEWITHLETVPTVPETKAARNHRAVLDALLVKLNATRK